MVAAAAIAASTAVSAGAGIYSANKQAGAAKSAASTSASQASADRRLQREMYQQQRADFEKAYTRGVTSTNAGYAHALKELDPYDNFGAAATSRLAALGGVSGSAAQQRALASDPGYQFRMGQGIQALDRSAAARGMLLSGAQAKGLSQFNQGLASEELNNAYNRTAGVADAARTSATNIANLYTGRGAALSNLAIGQGTQLNQLGTNTTNAITGINQNNTANQIAAQTAIGQARGSAYTGVANALNSGVSNGLFYYGMKNGMFGQGGQQ